MNASTSSSTSASSAIQMLMQQAMQLLKSGKLAEARSVFQKILAHAPDHTDALFRLSVIAFHQHDAPTAIELLNKVLTLDPAHNNARVSLANIYTQRNQPQDAIEHYQQLLSQSGANTQILHLLATNYSKLGDSQQAIKALQQATRMAPKDIELLVFLAKEQYRARAFKDALDSFQRVYKLGARGPHIFTSLAKIHDILGNTAAARETYEEGVKLLPDNMYLTYQLSRIDDSCVTPELTTRIEAQLKQGAYDDENTVYAHFLLARQAQKDKRYEEELALLLKGHARHKNTANFRYSPDIYLKTLVERALARTPDTLNDIPEDPVLSSMQPIFMVGVPRSGSTLLESVINAGAEDMVDTEESGVMLYANDFTRSESSEGYWENFVAAVKNGYEQFGIDQAQCRFTDKTLDHFFMVDIIFKVFPKAKVIWCRRHPLASMTSILQNNMIAFSWAHDMDQIIQYFENTEKVMQHWLDRFGDRIYTYHYEHFVSDPEQESKALFEFCDLDWTPECLNFYKNKKKASRTASSIQIRQKIYTKAVGAQDKYSTFFEPYAKRHPWLAERMGLSE